MGSFSYCYLQLLLWPPAYKSRCQVSLEFILLHSESLPFLLSPPILTCCIATVSALDTHSVGRLWTIFMHVQQTAACLGLEVRNDAWAAHGDLGIMQVQWAF